MNNHLHFAASLHRLYNLTLRDFGRANGLSQTEMDVLLFLHNNPDCNTARDMVHLRGLAKSMSTALDSLRTRGLVESRPEENNRRVNRLFAARRRPPLIEGLSRRQAQILPRAAAGAYPSAAGPGRCLLCHSSAQHRRRAGPAWTAAPSPARPEPEKPKGRLNSMLFKFFICFAAGIGAGLAPALPE